MNILASNNCIYKPGARQAGAYRPPSFLTAIRFCLAGSISNSLIATLMASFSVAASTVPRRSPRLRIMVTSQRDIEITSLKQFVCSLAGGKEPLLGIPNNP